MWINLDVFKANLLIREWLNGALFPLSANLAVILTIFLWSAWREGRRRNIRWQTISGIPTGCFLWWVFSAESIRAGTVWFILRAANDGQRVPPWFEVTANILFINAAIALVLAILRGTYIFTPPKWGHKFWIYSAISTALFLFVSHFFPSIGYGHALGVILDGF
jgi:hypothetical protein